MAVLNISSYRGYCADAQHYYGKLVLSEVPVTEKTVTDWTILHLGEVIQLKHEMTLEEAKELDKKDGGHTYERSWELGMRTTDRFNTLDAVHLAGGLEWKKQLKLHDHDFPFINLYEGERYDKTKLLVALRKKEKPVSKTKLTQKQIDTLCNLHEDKSWPIDTLKAHKNTLNALYFKGCVKLVNYANGEHWEMTDRGCDELNAVRPL